MTVFTSLRRFLALLSSSVKEVAVFVDLAPRFQLMAEDVLQRQIQLVMYNLKQAIDGANGFHNTNQINNLSLPSFVLTRIAKEILLLDDVAAEETLQLQGLIHLLFEHLSSLLESLLAADQRWKSLESQRDDLDDFVISVRKLRKLAELLDMPLKSITTDWEW